MWILVCGLLALIILKTADASPIFPKSEHDNSGVDSLRVKRQFGFPGGLPGFQNVGDNGFGENGVFFDNDNVFNDFVQPTRRRSNLRQSTPSPPQGFTTVAIPGMGTSPSTCEARCITTPQYDPVCGDNNVTYMNMARFNCAVRCGKDVRIAAYRACPRF